MDGPAPIVRTAMPWQVKVALVIVYFQVLSNLAGAFLAFAEVTSRNAHNQKVPALAPFLVAESAVLGLALLFCAIALPRLRVRIRPALVILEAIVVLGAVYNVVNGAALSGFGVGLAIFTMALLFDRRVSEWLTL